MNKTEFETLATKVGIEAANMIFVLGKLEGALMATAPKKEPFPSLLQSAEDERRKALNQSDRR